MDSVQEVADMLGRAGSFYYRNLSPDGKATARRMTQFYTNCRIIEQLKAAGTLALSGGYYNDFGRVIHFSDADIDYFGAKWVLQQRDSSGAPYEELSLDGYTALAETIEGFDKLLTELNKETREQHILVFPVKGEGDSSTVTLGNRSDLIFGLHIDPNLFITTITTEDGTVLFNGTDFISYFGLILFKQNPGVLFPSLKFLCSSCTIRKRNILSYPLGVNNVYGPVDRILEYYRVAQSIKTFYYAAAQACGLCVVPEDCSIKYREPLHKGCAYITTIGKLDAPYDHIMLDAGMTLEKNTVIGGNELFSIVLPGTAIPTDMRPVVLDKLLPISGLTAPNQAVQLSVDGKFNPNCFNGTSSKKSAYSKFLKESNGGELPDCDVITENAISYVLNTMSGGRGVIFRINESRLFGDMLRDLQGFIEKEAPIGVIVLTENMVNNF